MVCGNWSTFTYSFVMEVLENGMSFSKEKSPIWKCKVLLVNFKKLLARQEQVLPDIEHVSCDLLHAVAGLCSVALPDMELSAIYGSLTATNSKTAIVLASKKDVLQYRLQQPVENRKHKLKADEKCSSPDKSSSGVGGASEQEDDDVNPFSSVISDSEDSGSEEDEEVKDEFASSRETFISVAKDRKTLDQTSLESVGAESCVLGCANILRLSNKLGSDAAQITLLAVRKHFRRMGIGRYLMQCCKDPGVVGLYDALLVFADHKAESFFTRHGFTEDPIITARYKAIVDHWENSALMAYVPPFSGPGLAVGSIKSLTSFEEQFRKWRDTAICNYSIQLGVMERLRHELLLLHTKVQSQEEVAMELTRELKQAKEEKALLQNEFQQYRKHTQKLLCEATVGGAKEWLKDMASDHDTSKQLSHTTNS